MSQPPVKADGDLVAETLQLLRGIQTGSQVEPDVFRLPSGATDEISSVLCKWDTHFTDEILKHDEKARNYRELRDKSHEPWVSPTPLFDRPASPKQKAKDPDADTGEIAQGGPVVVRHLHQVSQGEERVAMVLLRDLHATPQLRDNLARGAWRLVDEWLYITGHPTVRNSDELGQALVEAGYLVIDPLPEDFAATASAAQFVTLTEKGLALLEHVPEGPVFFPELAAADEPWARRLLVEIGSNPNEANVADEAEDWGSWEEDLVAAGKPPAPRVEELVKQLFHDGMIRRDSQTDQTGEVNSWLGLTDKGDEVYTWLLNLQHGEPLSDLTVSEEDRHLAGRLLVAIHLRPEQDAVVDVADEFQVPPGLLRNLLGDLETAGYLQNDDLTQRGETAAKRILVHLNAVSADPDAVEDAAVTNLARALAVDNALARIGLALLVTRGAGQGKADTVKAVAETHDRTQAFVREVWDRLEAAGLVNRGVTPAGRELLPVRVEEPGPAEPPAPQIEGGPVAYCPPEDPAVVVQDDFELVPDDLPF